MKADELIQHARAAQRQQRFKDTAVLLRKDPHIHIVWLSSDPVETARRVLANGAKPVAILGVREGYDNVEIRIAKFPGAAIKPDYLERLLDNFAKEYERRSECGTLWEN